ncbi:hypothetical protein BGZ65_001163 [Modicella reniformis]|uniref:SAP domain-containing protein n=1 Tax=Modicella reniformis TaxID=1440133 RepID=A0A9P6MMA5_9FUNG|nr:hypothetical protein BGZ65_001163 [Modicella reniformis]
MIDPNSLKVAELKAELTARGLSPKGLKKNLVVRLEEALSAEGITVAPPTESASEPDVAPKEASLDHEDKRTDMDSDEPCEATTAVSEAQEIAKVAEPVTEPVDEDVMMTRVPDPAVAQEDVTESTTAVLEPVVGTPSLSQEGFVDTTTASSSKTIANTPQAESRKRSLDPDEPSSQEGSTSKDATAEKPSKRLKAIEIGKDYIEQITAAARDSLEADARRRSAAPSPSPALGYSESPFAIAFMSGEDAKQSSSSAPRSSNEDRRAEVGAGAGMKIDARTMMDKQLNLAAMDRHPEARARPPALPPSSKSSVTTVEEPTEDMPPLASLPSETTRALAITNFVRPLTVNQVKRMLSEFGEIQVLWMDSIRTHCYVTFKEVESAEKTYRQVKGQVFPKETGRPLEPHFITPEAVVKSIEAGEEAQKKGKRAVAYTGQDTVVAEPKRRTSIPVQKDDVPVILKPEKVEQPQVVQPTELFKMTKTQPALYYKLAKEFTPPNDLAAVTTAGEPAATGTDTALTSTPVATN